MKKTISSVGVFIAILSLSFTTAVAQVGDFKLGAGLLYGTEVEELGLKLGAEYRFSENWGGAIDFDIFFTEDNVSWWDINGNIQYIFSHSPKYHIYGLGGLNISTIEVQNTDDTEMGVNLGAGIEYHVNFGSLYGDVKFIFSDDPFEQLVLGGGVRIPINKN